jgi:tetratricopeptide (TPR) repeat protein
MQRYEKSLSVVPAAEVRLVENPSAASLRKSLRVNRMLSGSVNFAAPKPALTISLIDAVDVRTLNSETIPVTPASDEELPNTVTDLAIRWLGFHPSPEVRRLLTVRASCLPATNSLYRQARGYLGRYEAKENLVIAVDQFKKVIEVDPSCAQAFAGLGEACLRLYLISRQPEFLNKALNAARRARELNRDAPEVHITLGIVLRELGQSEDSRQELTEAIRLDPESADAYRELGYAFIQLKQSEKAEAAFKTAIDLNKDSWSGYSHLGYFYLVQKKDYAKAVENYQKVIELTPDNTRGYSMLGSAYFYLYDLPQAIQMTEKALSIKATSQVYTNLGTYYFLAKRYEDAVRMFERAVEMGREIPKSWGNLADAYRYVPGLKDKAKPAYEEAIRLAREGLARNPKDYELLRRLARYHAYLRFRTEALDEIRQARELAPQNAFVLETAVEAYEILGEREEALRALEEMVRAEGSLQSIVLSPDLAKLRSDPRYAAIMKGVRGIPALK